MNRTKIEELIARTQDPVQQATLLVLSSFDAALESNTRATEEIAKDLAEHRGEFISFRDKEWEEFRGSVGDHMREDREMKVSIRTGWLAGVLFMSVVNIVGGWVVARAINSNDAQDAQIRQLEMSVIRLERELAINRSQTVK